MRLTPEKAVGIKFEIWLEHYFKIRDFQQVRRNVEFHKGRGLYRQADIVFSKVIDRKIELFLVEAKYSSNGPIKYDFRQGSKEKAGHQGSITNLVDEIIERQKFVGAYKSILVTNKYFEDKLRIEAVKHDILLFDGKQLFIDYKSFGGKYASLEESIKAIDINRCNLNKNVIQL